MEISKETFIAILQRLQVEPEFVSRVELEVSFFETLSFISEIERTIQAKKLPILLVKEIKKSSKEIFEIIHVVTKSDLRRMVLGTYALAIQMKEQFVSINFSENKFPMYRGGQPPERSKMEIIPKISIIDAIKTQVLAVSQHSGVTTLMNIFDDIVATHPEVFGIQDLDQLVCEIQYTIITGTLVQLLFLELSCVHDYFLTALRKFGTLSLQMIPFALVESNIEGEAEIPQLSLQEAESDVLIIPIKRAQFCA